MAEIGQGLSEVEAPGPVQNKNDAHVTFQRSLEDEVASQRKRRSRSPFQFSFYIDSTPRESPSVEGDDTEGTQEYSAPPSVANLAEAAPGGIVENPNEVHRFSHHNLEDLIGQGRGEARHRGAPPHPRRKASKASRFKTNVFIWSHIILFSILGTLARVGLSLLTAYPAEPARFASLWPNFGGSLVLGFLSEGAELFRHPKAARSLSRAPPPIAKEDTGERSSPSDTEASGREKEGGHAAAAAAESSPLPVPLHIGLATGFCGSFTTYSAFMRDSFEALAGMLGTTSGPSPGQDFMSVAAVIIITLSMSIGGLKAGAHIAIFFKRYERKLPCRVLRGLDRASVVLGAALWACAIAMAVVLADRPSSRGMWWGQTLLSLAFAPLGALLRFAASMLLNNRVVGFPLGTFCVNMFGTLLLAVVWDLQRLPGRGIAANIGGDMVSCQILQAVEDGFCGCLTTVSTWVLELSTLRRRHSYQYGFASIFTSLSIVVVVMGPLKWTVGLSQPSCVAI